MQATEILIICATIAGPILAVQAQKAVERARERRGRKAWLFHSLMATRAARVSGEHVKALNMIDLVFYGKRIFGVNRRSKAEQLVLDAWKEYLDHLNTKVDEKDLSVWMARGEDLFVNLLFAISRDVHFSFDRVQLKKGAYSPIAHGDLEFEQATTRKLWLKVLSGQMPLKMEITNIPPATVKPPEVLIENKAS